MARNNRSSKLNPKNNSPKEQMQTMDNKNTMKKTIQM